MSFSSPELFSLVAQFAELAATDALELAKMRVGLLPKGQQHRFSVGDEHAFKIAIQHAIYRHLLDANIR